MRCGGAANGIVKILAEGDLPLTLREVAEAGAKGKDELVGRMLGFFAERVEFYLREAKGQAYDVVKAVMAPGATIVRGRGCACGGGDGDSIGQTMRAILRLSVRRSSG